METNNTSLVTSEVANLFLKKFKGGDQQTSLKLEKLISDQLDKTNKIYDVLAGSFLVSAPKGGNRETKIPYVFSINLKKIAAHLQSIDDRIKNLSNTPGETKQEESKKPTKTSRSAARDSLPTKRPTANLLSPAATDNSSSSINPLEIASGNQEAAGAAPTNSLLAANQGPKTLDVNINSFEGKSALSSLEEMLSKVLPKAFAEALSGVKGLGGPGEGGGGGGGGGGFLSGGVTALLAKWGLGKFFAKEGAEAAAKKGVATVAEEGAEAAAKKGVATVASEGAEQVAKKGILSRLGSGLKKGTNYLKSGGITASALSLMGGLGAQTLANKLTGYDPTFRKQDPEDLKQRVGQLKAAGDKEGLAEYKEFIGYQKENVGDEMVGKGAFLGGQVAGGILGRLKPVQNFTSNIASAVKSRASSALKTAGNVGTTIAKEVTSKATQLSARFTKSSAAQKRLWKLFMGFLKRKSPGLFAKAGIRLVSAAGLAALPIVGWIGAAIEIGMLAWTIYDIYTLFQEFRALDELEQAGYETDEKELLGNATPDSELSKLNENDLKNKPPKTRGEAAAQRDLKATPPKQQNKEDLSKQIADAKKKLEETTKSADKDKLQKIEALNKEIQQLEQQTASTTTVAEAPKPVTEAPKVEAPKPVAEAPKPVTEAPKVEAPKPVAEAPKVEAPKVEAPKPVTEAPKVEARKSPPINVDRDIVKPQIDKKTTDLPKLNQLSEYSEEDLTRFEKNIESRLDKKLDGAALDMYLNLYTAVSDERNKRASTKWKQITEKTEKGINSENTNLKPMAKGGVVTKPTKALIGEAGPEAVFPLEKLEKFLSKNNSKSESILQKIADNTGLTSTNLGGLIKGFNDLSKALKEAGAIKQAPIVVNNDQQQNQRKASVSQLASLGNPDHMQFRAGISDDMFVPV